MKKTGQDHEARSVAYAKKRADISSFPSISCARSAQYSRTGLVDNVTPHENVSRDVRRSFTAPCATDFLSLNDLERSPHTMERRRSRAAYAPVRQAAHDSSLARRVTTRVSYPHGGNPHWARLTGS